MVLICVDLSILHKGIYIRDLDKFIQYAIPTPLASILTAFFLYSTIGCKDIQTKTKKKKKILIYDKSSHIQKQCRSCSIQFAYNNKPKLVLTFKEPPMIDSRSGPSILARSSLYFIPLLPPPSFSPSFIIIQITVECRRESMPLPTSLHHSTAYPI